MQPKVLGYLHRSAHLEMISYYLYYPHKWYPLCSEIAIEHII